MDWFINQPVNGSSNKSMLLQTERKSDNPPLQWHNLITVSVLVVAAIATDGYDLQQILNCS
jgi:hypothetical protein